jgi:hypothetical protein
MISRLTWACSKCGADRGLLERDDCSDATGAPEGAWLWRCAWCGTPADTRDPLGQNFNIVQPEERCPN